MYITTKYTFVISIKIINIFYMLLKIVAAQA